MTIVSASAHDPIEFEGKVIPFPSLSFLSDSLSEKELLRQKIKLFDVSNSIDFVIYDVVETALEAFLSLELNILDREEVTRWLKAKAVNDGARFWVWRPLRKEDALSTGWSVNCFGKRLENGKYDPDIKICSPYNLRIPLTVLEKVKQIEDKFYRYVKFFVSHYEVPEPDPFIMVRPWIYNQEGSFSTFIFDCWDEPGFGI